MKIIPINIVFIIFIVLFISCDSQENINVKKYLAPSGERQIDPIDHFYFCGRISGRNGVYEYDLLQHNYKEIWSDADETIILLSYSDNLKYVFFVTARRLGASGGVAFIRGIKLYRISVEDSFVEIASEVGDAVQLFAGWEGMNFEIQFTKFDLRIASHINKINQIYSPFGKLLKEDKEVYDFIKEGYPNFEIEKFSLISPSGNLGLLQTTDSIYIRIAGSEQIIPIDSTGSEINYVKWSEKERFVFFTASSKNPNGKLFTTIYAYDIVTQLILKKQTNEGKKEFLLINNLLILDEYTAGGPSIVIFDYQDVKEIDTIIIKDGCGLKYLQGD